MKRKVLEGGGKTGAPLQAETGTIRLGTSAAAGDGEEEEGREKGRDVKEEGERALGLGPAHRLPM